MRTTKKHLNSSHLPSQKKSLVAQTSLPRASASVIALASIGVLATVSPSSVWAVQPGAILPNGTIPVLRGVANGQAAYSFVPNAGGGQSATIHQTTPNVIINWDSFNIDKNSSVHFDQQGHATWAALNRIFDKDPSIIQGKLTADGQVYLINQNGILFDKGSQINVGALYASTLNITNERFLKGVQGADSTTTPMFEGGYDNDGNPTASPASTAGIRIGEFGSGAAPTINALSGGAIVMLAPMIKNVSGVITSPDGQVILAAGAKAYLYLNDTSLSSNDLEQNRMRGMIVEVVADSGDVNVTSLIQNMGTLSADRGNVTLAGLMINQSGRASASTAVLQNGTVFLQGYSGGEKSTGNKKLYGKVVLGTDSLTEAPLDKTDTTTATEDQKYYDLSATKPYDYRGYIKVEGNVIHNRGQIVAHGGNINLLAKKNADDPAAVPRIYLDKGSKIDASGNWADLNYDSNFVTIPVTSTELKDSPDQKAGALKGQKVTIDLRKGSTVLDVSAYQAGRKRTVQEKATSGGTVTLASEGDLIARPDSVVDVSGGGYRYSGGVSKATRLIGVDGQSYDIATAPKDLKYLGVRDSFTRTYKRWGQTETFKNLNGGLGVSESAYTEGKPGGELHLTSLSGMVLDGNLYGGATAGVLQLSNAPRGGYLEVGHYTLETTQQVLVNNVNITAAPQDTLGDGFQVDSALADKAVTNLQISRTLFPASQQTAEGGYKQNGFDAVEVNAKGSLTIASDVKIDAPLASTLTLRATQIDVAGKINAPAGNVKLESIRTSDTSTDLKRGIQLHQGAEIITKGAWINQNGVAGATVGPVMPSAFAAADRSASGSTDFSISASNALNGGAVVLNSNNTQLITEAGSKIDVSGGAKLSSAGKVTAGSAGTITLKTGSGLVEGEEGFEISKEYKNQMDGTLLAYGITNGGKLVIESNSVNIGHNGDVNAELNLKPEYFQQGGFSSYDIKGKTKLTIEDNVVIHPQQKNWAIDNQKSKVLASGDDLASIATVSTLTDDQRKPTSIALRSTGRTTNLSQIPTGEYAALNLPTSSSIVTDPQASVTLESQGNMLIQGQIIAPGGNIALNVTGGTDRSDLTSILTLDETAKLLTKGTYIAKPDDRGLLLGTVTNGGSVTLNTAQSKIITKAGSVIDVSGTSQLLDVKQNDTAQSYVRKTVSSDAGSIAIKSNDQTDLQGSLIGQAEGKSAGGSFDIQFASRTDRQSLTLKTPNNSRIIVTDANTVDVVEDTQDLLINTNKLNQAGFDKVRLKAENSIEFQKDTNLEFKRGITLDTKVVDLTKDASQVILKGNTVTLADTVSGKRSISETGDVSNLSVYTSTTRAGNGKLFISADTVNLHGDVAINGVSETTINSNNDIRLMGRGEAGASNYQGSLTSEGNINLQAAQVYPITQSSYTIAVKKVTDINDTVGTPVEGSQIKIVGNGSTRGEVLSAGGKVTLSAENISQGGVIKAPLGTIDLQAGKTLALTDSSITSVSANGSVIPYGTTQAGSAWQDPSLQVIQSLPEKQIKLSGKTITQNTGATIDVSGGGDVQAVEFVAGSGGSTDTLTKANTYAILPKSSLSSVPVDSAGLVQNGVNAGSTYNAIHLGAGSGVPEGDYILLPGRYALLPGAYMVQLQTGSTYSALKAGQTVNLRNGQTVVSGYLTVAGTDIRQSQPIGVIVRPGSAAKTESDYNINNGNEFFTKLATQNRVTVPRLPNDGGKLSIAATDALTLNGNFNTNPANEKAQLAQVDISGQDNRIAVVDKVGRTDIASDYLQLEASSLSHLNASLLIGGTRSDATDATVVTAQSKEVLVTNNDASKLQAPELLLAAKENITVKSGSVLSGSGTKAGNSRNIKTDANSALIRLANNDQVTVDRGSNSGGGAGLVVVEEGATLAADKSLLIDATQNTQFKGNLNVQSGGAVSLASSKVSVGETDGVTGIDDGLVLSNTQLANLNSLDTVALKSYGSVDLYGNTQLGSSALNNLSLDSGALVAKTGGSGSAANSQITASNVTFKNTTAQASANTGATGGVLNVNANKLTIGAGNKAIRGFDTVNMTAAGDIVADGSKSVYDANGKLTTQPDSELTTLQVAGNLTMTAARITGSHGAYQSWQAADLTDANNPLYYNFNIKGNGAATPVNDVTSIGSRLALEGKSITSNGRVEMKSGSVTLAAKGNGAADHVTLDDGAVVDVGGVSKNFNGTIAVAGAGVVNVIADTGNVVIKQGANVLVNGIADGGDAGTLNIAANALQLDGQVNGAANAGQTQGKFNLDVQTLTDFSSLNSKLNSGSMTEQRTMRVRQGDVTIAADDTVTARQLQIATDNGAINVNGKLDASSLKGKGKVELYAKNDVTLADGSVIDASSTLADSSAYSDGGTVRVGSTAGKVTFAQGAKIDVSAAKLGKAGQVTFIAARNVGNDGMNADLQGTVLSKTRQSDKVAEVVAEGNKVYDTTTFANAGTEVNAFVTAATVPAIVANIKGDDGQAQGNSQVRAGVELQVAGDHTQADAIDLTDATTWLSNNQPGTLTIRSQGNLNINSSIGLPSDSLYQADGVTPLGKTWNINLVGGADLGAANPMAVQTAKQLNQNIQAATITGGDVVLGADAKIRTGTGNIQVAAAHDFNMANGNNNTAVIYTTGQIAAADVATSYGSASNYGRWANQGGNISITAQHDAIGSGNQWITDWYRRPKSNNSASNLAKLQGDWWAYRANFKQNIGTFAGGDIQIQAGHDIGNLSAMSATSGRTFADASQIEVLGGGDLLVQATNNIKGGSYLLGRGQGLIKAGNSVGSEQASQLYVMGESGSDVAAKQANLVVEAGNAINIASIANPTAVATDSGAASNLLKPIAGVVDPSVSNTFLGSSANFYTYSDNSQVLIKAKSGDIGLGDSAGNKYNNPINSYPATLLTQAFSGSTSGNGSNNNSLIYLFSSQQGVVKILADQNVFNLTLKANDTDPAALNSWRNPKKGTNSINVGTDDKPNTASRIVQRDQSGYVYDIQALNGGISNADFTLPAVSRIWANKSISLGNLSYDLQNLKATDISVIHSDKEDIRSDSGTINIAGPGRLVVQAGNSVLMPTAQFGANENSLGAITATGNNNNSNLGDANSARITVIAGVSGEVNLDKLDASYAALITAGQKNDPSIAKKAMDEFIGQAKVLGGNIDTSKSSIQSQGGSDIDLIAPNGNITVGSTTTPANVVGIVTTGGGAIRSYLNGNFDINQGKVLTARGGDVLIYTSEGGIDAGRGAKTARATAAPKKKAIKDADGNTIGYRYEVPPDAAGSGIQTATSDPDGSGPLKSPAPGSVYLFAPKGTIDAGEAGIVSAGNITIAAQTVLNATNISAAGSSQGVPQAVSGSLSATMASSGSTPTAGQDKAAEEAAKNAERSKMASVESIKPNILSVEVVGFGDKNCKESDSSCFGK